MRPIFHMAAFQVGLAQLDSLAAPKSDVARDMNIQQSAWELLINVPLLREEAECLFIELDASFNRLAATGYFPTGA